MIFFINLISPVNIDFSILSSCFIHIQESSKVTEAAGWVTRAAHAARPAAGAAHTASVAGAAHAARLVADVASAAHATLATRLVAVATIYWLLAAALSVFCECSVCFGNVLPAAPAGWAALVAYVAQEAWVAQQHERPQWHERSELY